MIERLVTKRGRFAEDKRVPEKKAKEIAGKIIKNNSIKDPAKEKDSTHRGTGKDWIKPVFRLSPPSKGYKSIRSDYPKGDLGNRGEAINELLKRMV